MPIEFTCPSCGAPQRAGDHLVGRTLRCYKCTNLFNVPVGSTLPPTPPAPTPAPLMPAGPTPAKTPAIPPVQAPVPAPVQAPAPPPVHASPAPAAPEPELVPMIDVERVAPPAAAEPAAAPAVPNLEEEFELPDGFSWEESKPGAAPAAPAAAPAGGAAGQEPEIDLDDIFLEEEPAPEPPKKK